MKKTPEQILEEVINELIAEREETDARFEEYDNYEDMKKLEALDEAKDWLTLALKRIKEN